MSPPGHEPARIYGLLGEHRSPLSAFRAVSPHPGFHKARTSVNVGDDAVTGALRHECNRRIGVLGTHACSLKFASTPLRRNNLVMQRGSECDSAAQYD